MNKPDFTKENGEWQDSGWVRTPDGGIALTGEPVAIVADQTVTEIMARGLWDARRDDERSWDELAPASKCLVVDEAEWVLRALIAAGYVIVPRVPTSAMLEAAMHAAFANPLVRLRLFYATEWAARIYTAMLQAAEGQ